MKIEDIEDATQTKDGTEVRIFEKRFHEVLGYWIDGFRKAHPAKWDIDGNIMEGRTICPAQAHILDLNLHDWRDEIPWGRLRDEIKYVVRDADGKWWGHGREPLPKEYKWQTSLHDSMHCSLRGVKMPRGPTDCRDAIAERPET